MSEGLYKKSVEDSIDPHLPGKNSREADKAAAAEEARARLRDGEDAAADEETGLSDASDAAGLENGGFYVGGGALALNPRGFLRRGIGRGKGKRGTKSGFKKYGPVALLFGLVFGVGGIIGAVQSLMPFHVIEQVTEMFDGSFTSRSARMPKMMKSIAKMDGKSGNSVVSSDYTKYRKGLKKYKKNLAKNGIDMIEEDGVTKLRWKNYAGDEITIGAEDFAKVYDADVDFRNDFSRGTRGFMGRIAAWIDLSAAKFFSSHSLTKNLWKDWQQATFRKEGSQTKFKDIIRGRRPDVDVEVGQSQEKTTPRKNEEGEIIGYDHDDTPQTTTGSAKTKAQFTERLNAIAGGISNLGCAQAAVVTAAVGIGYSLIQDNAQNAWQGVAEGVDKTKAGDGANAPIYDIGNYLSNKMTASAMVTVLSGGKIAPAQDSSLSKLNLSTIYESVGIGAGVAGTCAIAKVAIATVSIITTVVTGGIGKAIMGIGKTIGTNFVAGTAISFIVSNYLDSITTDLCLDTKESKSDDDPTIRNDDAGNCLAIGGLSALQTNFRGGGGTLGATDKVADFYDAYQVALQQEAEYDRATKSPFDATNGNTFLGSLVGELVLPVAELSTGPAGFISSIGGLVKKSVSSLLPSASAISKTEYLANQIGDCPLAESIGAVGNAIDCSPIMISDMGTMETDPDDVIEKVVNAGKKADETKQAVNGVTEAFYGDNFEMDGDKVALDENGIEKIKKGSHLDKYIRYCSYRESPFGVIDQNIVSAETTASADTGNTTIDTAIDSVLGAVPLLDEVIDIWNAYDEMNALQWATGANCVARSDDDTSVYASADCDKFDCKANVLGKARKDDENGGEEKSGESTSKERQYKKDHCYSPIITEKDENGNDVEVYDAEHTCKKDEKNEGYEVTVQDVEYKTLSWEEVKWYRQYVEDDRLVEMVDGEHSAVQNLLASYEEENPVDNSTAGVLARKTGMLKEDVEVALNEMAYWEYLADYEPANLYPTPVKEEIAKIELSAMNDVELPEAPEALPAVVFLTYDRAVLEQKNSLVG